MKKIIGLAFVIIGLLFSCKKENTPPENEKFFPKVKAIVEANCTISCHAPSNGLPQGLPVVLETDDDIASRSANIKAAVAGPFTFMNKKMPEGGMLSDADIDTIMKWVEKGGRISD